jgi:hypothetical protein
VTGALAVQKMSDPSLKQEVLQSKKGIEYFTGTRENKLYYNQNISKYLKGMGI